jgi:hypothetical protein
VFQQATGGYEMLAMAPGLAIREVTGMTIWTDVINYVRTRYEVLG